MQSRFKTFLTLSVGCVVPLLLIALLASWNSSSSAETMARKGLSEELSTTVNAFNAALKTKELEVEALAGEMALRSFIDQHQNETESATLPGQDSLGEVQSAGARLLKTGNSFDSIAIFSAQRKQLCLLKPALQSGRKEDVITKDFVSGEISPDERVWNNDERALRCSIKTRPSSGTLWRCTAPVILSEGQPSSGGALVADLRLDSLIGATTKPINSADGVMVIALDQTGNVIHHSNDALRHQPVSSAMPSFSPVAQSMMTGQSGAQFYDAPDGNQWLATYTTLSDPPVSFALARNYSAITGASRRLGWLILILALALGLGMATLFSTQFSRRSKSLDRVAEGVDALAQGRLDHQILLRSSDDLRPLADNVGLVTKQLREQLEREAESRQFQSFVRLSAVLSHDLKNAIGSLSLLVSNLERHFDDPEFRADAMKSLTGATDKLQALVTRLSNPVSTLSGEHKRPQPSNLVPMLQRVVSTSAGPLGEFHQIKFNSPESVLALVDLERMEKVAENLVINALEAMPNQGTLTVEAGQSGDKVFFSVTDTGEGMSERFIAERLFRPFTTTKRRGVGLGLYTCREVVRANAGTIEVQSEQGAGTTFRVVLPSPPS